MSFFDNTKNLGTVFLIVGLLYILDAIVLIAAGFIDLPVGEQISEDANLTLYCVIAGIGSLIGAILYVKYALKVSSGEISAKIDILASYVKIIGLVFMIVGIFQAIALAVSGAGIMAGLTGFLFSIIIGFIIMIIGGKINDGKQTVGDRIIWIILLIAFVLMFIIDLLGIVGSVTTLSLNGLISSVAGVLISVFMIRFLIDPEVRSQM